MVTRLTPRVLIRADGDRALGVGHVVRMLVLAEALKAAWPEVGIEFVSARLSPALERRIAAAGHGLTRIDVEPGTTSDAEQTLARAVALDATWIVLDAYTFPRTFRWRMFAAGRQVLAIDDGPTPSEAPADLSHDSRVGATRESCSPGGRWLLGPRYALLGQSFSAKRQSLKPQAHEARRLLITLGGADPLNLSARVLTAVASLGRSELETTLVVGPANPRAKELSDRVAATNLGCRVLVDPPDMAELLAWADVAMTAAGSTCWELALLGVPAVALIVADNQVPLAEALAEHGSLVNLGWASHLDDARLAQEIAALLDDPARRAAQREAGLALVDGRGADRVAQAMVADTLQLRPVERADAELLLAWANDPMVRANSFESHVIAPAEHVAWLERRLRSPADWQAWIAHDAHGEPVGVVRFDVAGNEATVAFSVVGQRRGSGIGKRMLGLAVRRLASEREVRLVTALVKPENARSLRALAAACFGSAGETQVAGQWAMRLVFDVPMESKGSKHA
jgi:UDP-2,4-diacetamido-2,4,6-trideoxy-beta-L-altropyranose hydrolase